MRLWRWIKRLFRKKQTPKPTPPKPVATRPINVPEPTIPLDRQRIEPDYVKDPLVDARNPDWHYIAPKLVIDKEMRRYVLSRCALALKNRERYEAVSERLGGKIPWQFIAALHERESGQNFEGVLHNGDRIIGTGRKTYRVPKGRGPFGSWEDAAVDALQMKRYHTMSEWTFGHCLERAEIYNGLGYRKKIGNHGWVELTPYNVNFTNYGDENSKYWKDGKHNKWAEDKQVSVGAMLIGLGYDD